MTNSIVMEDYISLPVRRQAEFDERFFGLRNNHLRHIAIKTGTHLSVPENPNRPVSYSLEFPLHGIRRLTCMRRLGDRDMGESRPD